MLSNHPGNSAAGLEMAHLLPLDFTLTSPGLVRKEPGQAGQSKSRSGALPAGRGSAFNPLRVLSET